MAVETQSSVPESFQFCSSWVCVQVFPCNFYYLHPTTQVISEIYNADLN